MPCFEVRAAHRKTVTYIIHDFFCVGVMYSGEYDACDVTLSAYPRRATA
jgi:hypothetical protein